VKFDPISDRETMPAKGNVAIVGDCFIRAGIERGRERLRNLPLECIASDVAHLGADGVETLAFALSDLDGQQL
jgi:hypothetical protein